MDRGHQRLLRRDRSNADFTSSPVFSDDTAFYQMIEEIATRRRPSMAGLHRNNSLSQSSNYPLVPQNSSIARLPPELLILIFSFLTKKSDLISACLVCKQWADLCIDLIWFRPSVLNEEVARKLIEVMMIPSDRTYWDYRPLIKRLNLSFVNSIVTDEVVELFQGAVNLERTTLVNCYHLNPPSICKLVKGCSKLQSIDVTGLKTINDDIYNALALNCPRLQGLYAPGSSKVSKAAVINLVSKCPILKRIRFCDCIAIDDEVILSLVHHCPSVVELDLQGCSTITDKGLQVLFYKLEQLREFKISQNRNISYECFDLLPNEPILHKLRVIDFTSCELIGDKAIQRLVTVAPKLRNVGLSKCTSITDTSLRYLSELKRSLNWIHLGHCSNITDFGAIALIKSCQRLQYVDFACCSQITNDTLIEMAQLPRLRRIGLVKCVNITDAGIEALANSRNSFEDTLERVHLSYCTQIGVFPVYDLLMACPKLTHLSLTGISAFLRSDITKFCRQPPLEFNENQKAQFCVFSGKGVDALRNFLHGMVSSMVSNDQLRGIETDRVQLRRDENGVEVDRLMWNNDPFVMAGDSLVQSLELQQQIQRQLQQQLQFQQQQQFQQHQLRQQLQLQQLQLQQRLQRLQNLQMQRSLGMMDFEPESFEHLRTGADGNLLGARIVRIAMAPNTQMQQNTTTTPPRFLFPRNNPTMPNNVVNGNNNNGNNSGFVSDEDMEAE